MIKDDCFSKQWLDNRRKSFPIVDRILLERLIYAFELVGNLVEEGLNFTFRGGTSLILLLTDPYRLSIDVDILSEESKIKIENVLDAIIDKGRFNKWEEDIRSDKGIPKIHYKCYYDSLVNTRFPSCVLLDVLQKIPPYPNIKNMIIKSPFFDVVNTIELKLPTINGILGDKLTAFAPHTTGILFGKGKAMEINKQLFDIGHLFDVADDINEVKQSFANTISMKNSFLDKAYTEEEVKDDLLKTCFLISQIKFKNSIDNNETREIEIGRKSLRSHLLNQPYNLEHLKTNSAKCAFLIHSFDKGLDFTNLKKYSPEKIIEKPLQPDKIILEKLKAVVPEAYYFWQLMS